MLKDLLEKLKTILPEANASGISSVRNFFVESKASVKRVYLDTGKITRADYNDLLLLDPTKDNTAKYFDWIVKQFLIRKSWKHDSKQIVEDMYRDFKQLLIDFDEAVEKGWLKDATKDLHSYEKWTDIRDIIKKLNSEFKKFGDAEIDFGDLKENQDYQFVETNDKAVVLKINNYKASKQLGSGAWCIVKENGTWNTYHKRGDEFYFIINLKEQNSNTNRVWTLVYNSKLVEHDKQYIEVYDGLNNRDYTGRTMPIPIAKKYIKQLGLSFSFNKDIHSWLQLDDEKEALKSPESAYYYARYVLKQRFEKGEKVISKSARYSYDYALDILKGRFEKGEKVISKSARYSYYYARYILKQRFEKGEEAISKSAEDSYYYAFYVLKGRFEKGEQVISKNAEDSYYYALDVLKGRFEKGEKVISKNVKYSYFYAKSILKGRFEKGEKIISKDAKYSYYYALYVLESRFPEGESIISKDAEYSRGYIQLLKEKGIQIPTVFKNSDILYDVKSGPIEEAHKTVESIKQFFVESKASVKRDFLSKGKIDQDTYDILLKLDPTKDNTAKYFEWIVRQHLNNYSTDDIKVAVDMFDDAVRRNIVTGKFSNIYMFKTVDTVREYIDSLMQEDKPDFSNLQDSVDYEIYDESDKGMSVKLLTFKASEQLGTRAWCTTISQDIWDEYVEKDVTIYILYDFTALAPKSERMCAVAYADARTYGRTFMEAYNADNQLMSRAEYDGVINRTGLTKNKRGSTLYIDEEFIAQYSEHSYKYAELLKKRFERGEPAILTSPNVARQYVSMLKDNGQEIPQSFRQFESAARVSKFFEAEKEITPTNINTPKFRKWFRGSKVVDSNKKPIVVYHGSGMDVTEFSYEFTGKGNDQYGSGFYFTTDETEAKGYSHSRIQSDVPKLGGEDSPTVLEVYLSIKKPLDADKVGSVSKAKIMSFIRLAPKESREDGISNWGDVGFEGYHTIMNRAAESYVIDNENIVQGLFAIANDFYGDDVRKFNFNVKMILGYDGIVKDFGSKKHYVAFFPWQIKSIYNSGNFNADNNNIYEINGFYMFEENFEPFEKDKTDIPYYDEVIKGHRKKIYAGSERYADVDWKIVDMNPMQYIRNCAANRRKPSTVDIEIRMTEKDLIDKYAEDMLRGDKFPTLVLDKITKKQEGRHRALAAEKLGVKTVPVLVVWEKGRSSAIQEIRTFFEQEEKQLADTSSPEFKQWFGKSKLVDKSGKPLVFYHGSGIKGIKNFEPERSGTMKKSDWGKGIYFTPSEFTADYYREEAAKTTDKEAIRLYAEYEAECKKYGTSPMDVSIDLGFQSDEYNHPQQYVERWLQRLKEVEQEKTGEVYPVYLRMENPYFYTPYDITDYYLADYAKEYGHDGVVILYREKSGSLEDDIDEVLVFDPNQIKSVYNNGRFSPYTDNIYEEESVIEEVQFEKEDKTNTPEFKQWFGKSVTVRDGKPQVFYHGSNNEFESFEEQHTAEGFYFSTDEDTAAYYGDVIYPVYLKIEKLVDLDDPFDFKEIAEEAIIYPGNIEQQTVNRKTLEEFGNLLKKLAEQKGLKEYQEAYNNYIYEMDEGNLNYYEDIQGFAEKFDIVGIAKEIFDVKTALDIAYEAYGSQEFYMNYQNDFMQAAQNLGYDGVVFTDPSSTGESISYVVFEPNQIKSVDNNGSFNQSADIYESVFQEMRIFFEDVDRQHWYEHLTDVIYDVWKEFIHSDRKPRSQPWPVVGFSRVKKIWEDYATSGFIRDTKGMQDISDIIVENIGKIYANTVLSGHTPDDPDDYMVDYDRETGKSIPVDDSVKEAFYEYIEDATSGIERISDYALDDLMEDAFELQNVSTAEEQLQIVDRVFNRIHMRSDIASWFIKGGSTALLQLSDINPDVEEITLHIKTLYERLVQINEARYSVDFLKKKYVDGNLLSRDTFAVLQFDIDPTKDKKYLEWLCRMYVKEFPTDEMWRFGQSYNDGGAFKKVMQKFYIASTKNILKGRDKDINSYKSFKELIDKMDEIKIKPNKPTINFTGLDDGVNGDYETIFENEFCMIVVLKTFEAAQQLCPSSFCIQHDESHWGEYVKDNIAVYLIFDYTNWSSNTDKIWGVSVYPSGSYKEINNGLNKGEDESDLSEKLEELEVNTILDHYDDNYSYEEQEKYGYDFDSEYSQLMDEMRYGSLDTSAFEKLEQHDDLNSDIWESIVTYVTDANVDWLVDKYTDAIMNALEAVVDSNGRRAGRISDADLVVVVTRWLTALSNANTGIDNGGLIQSLVDNGVVYELDDGLTNTVVASALDQANYLDTYIEGGLEENHFSDISEIPEGILALVMQNPPALAALTQLLELYPEDDVDSLLPDFFSNFEKAVRAYQNQDIDTIKSSCRAFIKVLRAFGDYDLSQDEMKITHNVLDFFAYQRPVHHELISKLKELGQLGIDPIIYLLTKHKKKFIADHIDELEDFLRGQGESVWQKYQDIKPNTKQLTMFDNRVVENLRCDLAELCRRDNV